MRDPVSPHAKSTVASVRVITGAPVNSMLLKYSPFSPWSFRELIGIQSPAGIDVRNRPRQSSSLYISDLRLRKTLSYPRQNRHRLRRRTRIVPDQRIQIVRVWPNHRD